MYDPVRLREKYMAMEAGKSRMVGIHAAIEAADSHGDVPYQIYFRIKLCEESCFYGDELDMMVIFPELLALADQHPDAPTTRYNRGYKNSMDNVLWIYKWILSTCEEFYQIPLEDYLKFQEDYKNRCLAMGYSLRPYYEYVYSFYDCINDPRREEAFAMFQNTPWDENCNCKACERNTEIDFYLDQDDLERATAFAYDIENFTLTCGAKEKKRAWLRMKKHFLRYYLRKRDFKMVAEYCGLLERNKGVNKEREFDFWSVLMESYSYIDIGKALKIYKDCWKILMEERCPSDIYGHNKRAAIFFRELGKARKGEFVKLSLDAVFPGYREDGRYRIRDMYRFHYNRAKAVADKFDERNGTNAYCAGLEKVGLKADREDEDEV